MSSQKQMRSAFAMIAILYFIRGTFLPYIFQVIQGLSHLSLIQIGGGLTLFTISQAAVGPLVGSLFSSGNPRRPRILIPALFGLLLLATASLKLNWIAPSAAWVLTLSFLGISFTTLRIGFNTTLLKNTPVDKIRSVVSLRATVLNIGAFAGTVLSSYTLDKTGVQLHAVVTMLVFLLLHLGLLKITFTSNALSNEMSEKPKPQKDREALFNRHFWSDALILFAVFIPYGCWGTIIPKFAIDLYGSNAPVRWISATSLLTIIALTYFFNAVISKKTTGIAKHFSFWPLISIIFFQISFMMLGFAANPAILVAACFVFETGEIFFTPLTDISASRHLNGRHIGLYLGILCLLDGIGRALGAWIGFQIYNTFAIGSTGISHPVAFWLITGGVLGGLSFISLGFSRLVLASQSPHRSDKSATPEKSVYDVSLLNSGLCHLARQLSKFLTPRGC